MQVARKLLGGVVAVALAAGNATPASATTLKRAGLDQLVAENRTIVLGEVVDANSYWNAEGTFILTDVRFKVHEVLKGDAGDRDLTFTLMGGTVGDLTSLIIGGPELVRGNSYLLFVDEWDLPGAKGVQTVRYLSQGTFDIVMAGDGLRAISQAHRHPMAPDVKGNIEAPGGAEGISLVTLMRSIRELAARPQGPRREVK